jgi:predicted P-loop ATPase/GTPase
MNNIDYQLKNIILGHILEFETYYAKAKIIGLNSDFLELKYRTMLLLMDCYNLIYLYENNDKDKETNFKKLKAIENDLINKNPLSYDDIKDMYEIMIKIIKEYTSKDENK